MASYQLNNKFFNRTVRHFFKFHYRCSSAGPSSTSTSSAPNSPSNVEINIPFRIERGPTDILKALSSTVKKDTYGPHYKYMDDPWLIPKSNLDKRSFALSKESGKKAARYFLDKNPEWFSADPAEPKVPRFNAPEKFDENTPVEEEDLMQCIASHDVTNAKVGYDIMVKNGQEISEDTKIALLEFLCFYNGKDPLDDDYLEERWYKLESNQVPKNTWADDMHIDAVYKSITSKDGRAQCALLLGLARHYSSKRAYKLYEEMKEQGIPLNLHAYNALIQIVPFVKESAETMWELVLNLCQDIKSANLKPNLTTYNAILSVLARCSTWRNSKSYAKGLLSEMNKMGIVPSLGTYAYLLEIYYSGKGPASTILHDILKEIEGQEFYARHPKDVEFFVNAMEVANFSLTDVEAAEKILAVLNTGQNYKMLGSSHNESVFYRNYIRLLCMTSTIDKIMEAYSSLTPHIYIPEPTVMTHILQAVELYEAYQHLPRFWKDIKDFRLHMREEIISEVLRIAAKCTVEDLYPQLVDIAWDTLKTVKEMEDNAKRNFHKIPIIWSGDLLGNALKICIQGKDMVKSEAIFTKLEVDQDRIMGFPDVQILKEFCKYMLECGQSQIALRCVKYDLDNGTREVANYVAVICEEYEIPENFRQILENLMAGEDGATDVQD